jgi:Ca-activated chloride channel family protein
VTFASPALLAIAAAVAVGLVILFRAAAARRRLLLGRLGEAAAVQRMMASASPGRRRLKAVLASLGLLLILVAAARPQRPSRGTVQRSGLDLVVAIDVSTSMLVRDVGGETRLERAHREVDALFGTLERDRVSIVLFAGAAVHFPLTEDHAVARAFAREIGPGDLPGGSDLGEALRVSRCLLRPDLHDDLGCRGLGGRGRGGEPLPEERGRADDVRDPDDDDLGERGKAILVLADGADSQGTAGEEVLRARGLGIAVFFAGVGSAEGGPVPALDGEGHAQGERRGPDGRVIVSRLDDAALRGLATVGGDVRRYRGLDPMAEPDPAAFVAMLRPVARGIRTRRDGPDQEDVYPLFLFPGFLLLVIEACIGTRRRARHPEETP